MKAPLPQKLIQTFYLSPFRIALCSLYEEITSNPNFTEAQKDLIIDGIILKRDDIFFVG